MNVSVKIKDLTPGTLFFNPRCDPYPEWLLVLSVDRDDSSVTFVRTYTNDPSGIRLMHSTWLGLWWPNVVRAGPELEQ